MWGVSAAVHAAFESALPAEVEEFPGPEAVAASEPLDVGPLPSQRTPLAAVPGHPESAGSPDSAGHPENAGHQGNAGYPEDARRPDNTGRPGRPGDPGDDAWLAAVLDQRTPADAGPDVHRTQVPDLALLAQVLRGLQRMA